MSNKEKWELLNFIKNNDEKIIQAERLAQQDMEALEDYAKIAKKAENVESY